MKTPEPASDLPLALQVALDRDIATATDPEIPFVGDELVAHLDAKFPLRNPEPDASIERVQRIAGFQEAVLYIKDLHSAQE